MPTIGIISNRDDAKARLKEGRPKILGFYGRDEINDLKPVITRRSGGEKLGIVDNRL